MREAEGLKAEGIRVLEMSSEKWELTGDSLSQDTYRNDTCVSLWLPACSVFLHLPVSPSPAPICLSPTKGSQWHLVA